MGLVVAQSAPDSLCSPVSYFATGDRIEMNRKDLIACCESLHNSNAPSYCMSDDGTQESNHWAGTMCAMEKHLERKLTADEVTCLSLSRGYGPTPSLGQADRFMLMEHLWPGPNSTGMRYEWDYLANQLRDLKSRLSVKSTGLSPEPQWVRHGLTVRAGEIAIRQSVPPAVQSAEVQRAQQEVLLANATKIAAIPKLIAACKQILRCDFYGDFSQVLAAEDADEEKTGSAPRVHAALDAVRMAVAAAEVKQ